MFVAKNTVKEAILGLRGTANHLLKIWLVLKLMGLDDSTTVSIDTSNSTPYLKRLFGCGAPDGSFFIPFSHTSRFAFMKSDASRSIIQTTLQRWASSGSVVTCDPSSFLKIANTTDNKLLIKTGRQYPLGLGSGKNGFALEDGQRVSIPAELFAVWLYCREDISNKNASDLVQDMISLLNLSSAEFNTIFIRKDFAIHYQENPITDNELYDLCEHAFDDSPSITEILEPTDDYIRRVKNMVTITERPSWIQTSPEVQLRKLINEGESSILLYGPPRTGKTRAIDQIVDRESSSRISIQLHEGWGYENLITGLYPSKDSGSFEWKDGALLKALKDGKKYIILEEINRTNISQALGEVFSLIEPSYRGEKNGIILPNGEKVSIPKDTIIIMTMNTIDTSTEDIDDALVGRMACVFFPPRVEDLNSILISNGIGGLIAENIKEVFNSIQTYYPLGHGYFARLNATNDFKQYYLSRIRPVLSNHFDSFKPEVLLQIDNMIDSLF